MNILFVCTANVSRSFTAEMLLKHEIEQLNLSHIAVSSAGLYAFPGSSPDPKMVEHLENTGVIVDDHESRLMTVEDVEWADIILVMENAHRLQIEGKWPSATEKLGLLGSFVSGDQNADDIVDPFMKSPFHYRLARSQITLAIKNLVNIILSVQTANGEDIKMFLKRLRGG